MIIISQKLREIGCVVFCSRLALSHLSIFQGCYLRCNEALAQQANLAFSEYRSLVQVDDEQHAVVRSRAQRCDGTPE